MLLCESTVCSFLSFILSLLHKIWHIYQGLLLLYLDIHLIQDHYLKRLSFLHWTALAPLPKVSWLYFLVCFWVPLCFIVPSLFFHQYYIVSMTIASKSWNQVGISPPNLFFFFHNCFVYSNSFTFPYKS